MSKRRFLLLLKPFNAYPSRKLEGLSGGIANAKMLQHLEDRVQVHKDAINFCKDVLKRKLVDWEPHFRDRLTKLVRDVDLVITVGGDGTLLQASHFLDDSIPVLGVNSDPTRVEEVEKFSREFDAVRSTGYLCAATTKNFEEMLDDILENRTKPSQVSRISISINSEQMPTHALNDLLMAHPCPASVSRFSFSTRKDGKTCTPSVMCRSSGLRVSTAAGSTAAMLSAGGFPMHILSKDLQYMVREPISPSFSDRRLMHGLVKSNQILETLWLSEKGFIYIDGSHVSYPLRHGDVIKICSKGRVLKIYLPHRLSSQSDQL